MTSALIVGAGAIGLNYGFKLKTLGSAIRVGLLARSNFQALKEQGYAIINYPNAPDRKPDVFKPDVLYPFDGRNAEEKFDYIIVTTKSLAIKAVTGLEKYAKPDTLLLLAQNGVDIEEPYLRQYPKLSIASAVVRCALAQETPTSSSDYAGFISLSVGLVRPDQKQGRQAFAKLQQLLKMSKDGGFTEAKVVEDVVASRWEKTLWNGSFNSLAAISNLNTTEMLEAGLEDAVRLVGNEIYNVGVRAIGQDRMCPPDSVEKAISYSKLKAFQGFLPSTLQDVRKGKPIEFEALTGNVVRAADRLGVEVPNLKLIYMMLKAVNYRLEREEKS